LSWRSTLSASLLNGTFQKSDGAVARELANLSLHGPGVTKLTARSDAKGVARIRLAGAGKWYIKFIHMTPISEPNLNYESKWASLTFEIK